jgi:hypothetical protein
MSAISGDYLVGNESRVVINIDLEIRGSAGRLYVRIVGIQRSLRRGNNICFWTVVEVPGLDHRSGAVIKMLLEQIRHFWAVEACRSSELLLNINQLLLVGIVNLLGNG